MAITLDTGLVLEEFSKTGFARLIKKDAGIKAKKQGGGWFFEAWYFEETFVTKNKTVAFLGEGEATNDITQGLSKKDTKDLIFCLDAAIKQNIDLPQVGVGGILFLEDEQGLLFLPQDIYQGCISRLSEGDYCKQQGFFINPFSKDKRQQMFFLQGVLCYYYLCGCFPFMALTKASLASDIMDCNFVLTEHHIPTLNKRLAMQINTSLACHTQNTQNKTSTDAVSAIGTTAVIDINLLFCCSTQTVITDAQLKKLYGRFYKKRQIKLNIKRFITKNTLPLAAGSIVAFFLLCFFISWGRGILKSPTTKGLTALQTVEAFYTAVDEMNAPLLKACSKGKTQKDYQVIVSGFYINAKTRLSFDEKDGTFSPAVWLYFDTNTTYWVYGITNFMINNTEGTLGKKANRICDFAKSQKLKDKAQKKQTFLVECDFVRSEGTKLLFITHYQDTVTTSFIGGRFLVTDIKSTASDYSIQIPQFTKDWQQIKQKEKKAQQKEGGGISTALLCQKLKLSNQKYFWLPTTKQMLQGAAICAKTYNNSNAKLDLPPVFNN